MKRLFTLLLLTIAAYFNPVSAQTNCNADFTYAQVPSTYTYNFTPAMLGTGTNFIVSWNFGDGALSTTQTPSHTYAGPGAYTVKHIVKYTNPNGVIYCIDSVSKIIQVPYTCILQAGFYRTISTSNSLTHYYTQTTLPIDGADSVRWTFGDGSSLSGLQSNTSIANPSHTFANAGIYNVCLRVKKNNNPAGTVLCISDICHADTVTVSQVCNIQAYFNWHADTSNYLKIYFNNYTTNILATDSIRWEFGDGSGLVGVEGNPSVANPIHTYSSAGVYTACMHVKRMMTSGAPCTSEYCRVVTIVEPCTLVANFTFTSTSTNPLVVSFTNTSTPSSPTDSVFWNFGDGSTLAGLQSNSSIANPVHTYANYGNYNACLKVKKNNSAVPPVTTTCIRDICKPIYIYQPCTLVANFTFYRDSLNHHVVHFSNTSTPSNPTDSVYWNFGDGSTLAGLQSNPSIANPVHTYANLGGYNVCLKVKKNSNISPTFAPCVRDICKMVYITEPCTLVVDFNYHADSLQSTNIHFTNLSTPLALSDSIRWNFGDGMLAFNVINPNHVYAQAGTYTVCLWVKKNNTLAGASPCVRETCKVVVVYPLCNFTPSWTWAHDSANSLKIHFTNTTVVPTATSSAIWYFGDGSSATTWNAVHEYANAGRYYVCLRVSSGTNCVRYKCDSITVLPPPPPCNNQSNFTYSHSSTNNQTYTFTPAYQSSIAHYIWTFGDGTSSMDMIAVHHFALPGAYNVCLTVWRTTNCASTTCKTVVVQAQFNCDSVHVSYVSQQDPFVPNKFYFYAVGNFPILDQTWTFKKVSPTVGTPVILHQNNPIYVFPDTGYYSVCLRAITLGGCIKEYCNYVHVAHVGGITTQCTLQAYPNPASSQVSVNVTLGTAQMINAYMYNTLNILVREKHQQGATGNNTVTFSDISTLVPGWYTIKVIHGNDVCYARFQKL